MENENDYLEVVNDLRDQYDAMKQKYGRRIAALEATIKYLKEDKGQPQLNFTMSQFHSSRPTIPRGKYTHEPIPLKFYKCKHCDKYHNHQNVCLDYL